jgi:hypothetical protein
MTTIKKTIGSKRAIYTHTKNGGVINVGVEVEDVDGFAYITPIDRTLGDIFKEMDEQFKEMEEEFKQMDEKITVFNKFLNKLYKHNN